MRNVYWEFFATTGNLESYLYYKEHERLDSQSEDEENVEEMQEI